jgi:hypothetical protein
VGTVPLDGFIGPAHVSTVIGSRPYEFFAEEYRKPVVIAGFEPLDVMQAILMLVRQVNEGRAEVENEFTRAVTRDGNLKAQAAGGRGVRTAPQLRMARPGRVPYSALRIRPKYAAFDAERRFGLDYRSVPTTRPASAAPSCAASSGRRTARSSARCARRRTRWARAWCRPKAPARRITPTDASRTCIERWESQGPEKLSRRLRAAARPEARPRRHDATARRPCHGAADRRALRRAFDNEWLARATTAPCCRAAAEPGAAHGDGHRQPRGLAAVLSGRRHRLPVGARHGQRRGDDGRAPLYLAAGFILEEGLSAGRPASASSSPWPRPRAKPACPSSPATPRWSSGQGRRRVHHHHRHRRGARRRATSRRRPARPGDASWSPARWATTAWPSCRKRENLSFDAPHRVRHRGAATAWSRRCWPPCRPSTCCATRRAAAWPPRSTNRHQSGVGMLLDEAAMPGAPEVARPANSSAWTRCTSPTKASWSPSAPATTPTPAGRHARPSAGARRRAHRRGGRRRPPLRADDHPLRRQAHRRLAGGAHVEQVDEEVVGQHAGPLVNTPCADRRVGAQHAQAADQHRHLRRGQRQQLRLVEQQLLGRTPAYSALRSCGSRRPGSSTAKEATSVCSCVASVRPGGEGHRDRMAGLPSRPARPPRSRPARSGRPARPSCRRLRGVERLLDAFQRGQHLASCAGWLTFPVLLRRQADARAVGAAALVAAAEGGGRGPGGGDQFGDRQAGGEDLRLQRGDVLRRRSADGRRRAPGPARSASSCGTSGRGSGTRAHVAVGQLEPGAGEGVGELLRVLARKRREIFS